MKSCLAYSFEAATVCWREVCRCHRLPTLAVKRTIPRRERWFQQRRAEPYGGSQPCQLTVGGWGG